MPDLPATGDLLGALREIRTTLGLGVGLASRADRTLTECHPAEHRLAVRMTPQRRADFLGGRAAIRRALADARLPQPDQPILPGRGGEPVLPDGIAASVSHSRGIAVALAAPASRFSSIGVDVEFTELPARAAHLVLTEPERTWLMAGCPPAERDRRLLDAFSAKESACKALAGGTLRQIHLLPFGDSFLAWPRHRREPRLRVWVRRLGAGVLTWTAVPGTENRACVPAS